MRDGSSRPNKPFNADAYDTRRALRWESDEGILTLMTDDEMRAAQEDALWPLVAGDVIQPRCMCGKWASVGECENCQRELARIERDCAQDARNHRERRAWKRSPGSAA